MGTVVVYDSVFGNTETVAQVIGSMFSGDVEVLHVNSVELDRLANADLLIIGSPTHGALPSEAIQHLLERIGAPVRENARVAAFDTRLTWPFLERWGGFAAPKIVDALSEKGWIPAGDPGGFFVKGLRKGPLKKGELDRAAAWARELL